MRTLKTIALGFVAGAIATLTVHEIISWIFASTWTGWTRVSWSMDPVSNVILPDVTVPKIVSAAFWGGLWGSVFALVLGERPTGPLTFRGLALGIVGPALLGLFLIVPLIKGLPPFFGGDASRIIPALVILGGFGAATAWLYGLFRYGRLPGCDDC